MVQSKRYTALRWLACAAMLALSYVIFSAMIVRVGSDLSIHATWAGECDFTDWRSFFHHGAHPMWHTLVTIVRMTGLSNDVSAVLVTALLKTGELWLLIGLCARLLERRDWLAVLCGVCASMVSAVCVPLYNPTVYAGVGSPNTWHSPTQLIAIAFMLICVPLTARCVEKHDERLPIDGAKANVPWRDVILPAVLLLASLLAKPTFMQAFLPAACLYFLVRWIRKPSETPFILRMICVALPSVLFMVLQYMYYFGIIVPWQSSMTLLVTWDKTREVVLSVLLTRLFPLFVLIFCMKRETLRKPLWSLTLWMEVVSILEMLLLSETGRRASDGNFGWAMMGSALMLWALTLPTFLKQFTLSAKEKNRKRGKYAVGFALIAWHLASGIYYIAYLLGNNVTL